MKRGRRSRQVFMCCGWMWKSEATFRRRVSHSFHHRFGESNSGPQSSGRNAFIRYPPYTQSIVSETVHSDPCVQGRKSGYTATAKKLTQNYSSTKASPFWQDSPMGHCDLTAVWVLITQQTEDTLTGRPVMPMNAE